MASRAEPMRLTDLAEALRVDKSNASHLLKTLLAAGYAVQDAHRRYSASAKIAGAAREAHTLEEIVAVKEAWRPALEELVRTTNECAHLAVLVGNRVWYVDKVDSPLQLKVDHPIGALSPLHCTALGKAFLAFGRAPLPTELQIYTPNTLATRSELSVEIERTLARGYAVDNEEFAQGIRCVARPIYDANGEMIAALGVSGPSVRVDTERIRSLGRIVQAVSIADTGKEAAQ